MPSGDITGDEKKKCTAAEMRFEAEAFGVCTRTHRKSKRLTRIQRRVWDHLGLDQLTAQA